ncbi:MAG TPA: hypothetical protein VK639_21260 [Terriglobales bacterium]|nr:hypothetical protein [Terriglobales bacterium]
MRNGNHSNVTLHGMVFGPSGNDRLCLFHVAYEDAPGALDFHSLVWETRAEGDWRAKSTISRSDFQGSHKHRRWVSELHSIDPKEGSAIIQVGEADRPESENSFTVLYSWRRWNVATNIEIERLQDCESPFNPYRPEESEDG